MQRKYASQRAFRMLALAVLAAGVGAAAPREVSAQTPPRLNENCIVSVLNRNTRVRPDGSWVLPNIPANFGLVRARATCTFNGQTVSGESAPFLILANGSIDVPPIVLAPSGKWASSLMNRPSASMSWPAVSDWTSCSYTTLKTCCACEIFGPGMRFTLVRNSSSATRTGTQPKRSSSIPRPEQLSAARAEHSTGREQPASVN